MKIVKYKKLKNNLYEILLDNNEKIKIYEDIILKENLLWKKEIDDLDELIKKNSEYEIYEIALKRLSNHVESEKGIYNYLIKKGYDDKKIIETIKKLTRNGYINDSFYAKSYINNQVNLSNDGPLKIIKHLEDNNITSDIYSEYLDNYQDIWFDRIKRYVNKQLKINKKSTYYFKSKMLINLSNLGYEKEDIEEVLNNISIDNLEELKDKEKEKLRKKLEKKYSGEELERKIKEKLYQKGFFN